ncbi:hypothetical protein HK096_011652 [Nowakowskiella sp. JEL0078]|nr:hypothetical protein HK096_011652 [Nowakowskiella sp. JEL0078]
MRREFTQDLFGMLTLIAVLVLVSVCGFALIHGFSKNRSPQEFTTESVGFCFLLVYWLVLLSPRL